MMRLFRRREPTLLHTILAVNIRQNTFQRRRRWWRFCYTAR